MTKITKKELIQQNLHWQDGEMPSPSKRRFEFERVVKNLETDPISLITGPRRVGKSVLIKQVINYLIKEKQVSPRQILFFEFSNLNTIEDIRLAFELYRDEFANNTQRQYIFFDEVQYIDDYQEYIKLIYDKRKTEIKFFLTGSLSLDYKKRVQDSLAGRYFEYRMFPLFFEEYLYLSGHPLYQQFLSVKNDPDLAKVTGLTEKLSSLFRDFLYFYRLPETIGYDQEQATLYIQTVKAQSLNKDVLDYFEVRKPQLINLLYEEIVRRSGDEISLRSLSQKGFKTTHQTLSKYLEILEIMSLVYVVYNTDKLVKQTKALKKVYTSSHFCSEDRDVGYLVESYVLERLLSESNTVTFYRQRNKEVDFLLPKKKQAIEVKYRSKLEPEDLISLGEFSKKRGFQSKIVTLKDYGHDVLGLGADLVPAMLF